MSILYVGFGANIGDRKENIRKAIKALGLRIGSLLECSSLYENAPMGFDSPNRFFNAVAAFETSLDAMTLLAVTQEVEKKLGRQVKSSVGGYCDRPIDIDLLLFDDLRVSSSKLTLPHPQMAERRFVLKPLAEIAPLLIHPITRKTIKAMLKELDNSCQIEHVTDYDEILLKRVNALLSQLVQNPRILEEKNLCEILANPNTQLHILRDETGNISGMASLSISTLPTGKKAWIEDVVVSKDCRGRGYGKALVKSLETSAKELGATCIMLTSRPARVVANELYKSLGFELKETNVYTKSL